MDARHPDTLLTELGKAVDRCWHQIPAHHLSKGRKIKLHASICMPDHFHGVIEVLERMDVSVGEVICGFKIGCTQAWREQAGTQEPPMAISSQPYTVSSPPSDPYMVAPSSSPPSDSYMIAPSSRFPLKPDGTPDLHRMSHKQRREYYATLPRTSRPLFDDNYDDTISLSDIHRQAMIHYVHDNPRRAIIRKLYPHFMQRCLHVNIAGCDYAAFGNLFLLRWATKLQVFCHRKYPGTNTPYEQTNAFQQDHDRWISAILQGATVLVTPGISKGEQIIKNECLQKGYPLIHLQKDRVGEYWKPEKSRFEACCNGSLLILAPWQLDTMDSVNGIAPATDYSRFHNLNSLAEEICHFDGEARIVKM